MTSLERPCDLSSKTFFAASSDGVVALGSTLLAGLGVDVWTTGFFNEILPPTPVVNPAKLSASPAMSSSGIKPI